MADRSFSKLVALKTILPNLAKDPNFEKMFVDEARVAAAVLHPNVCSVQELGDEEGVLYVVMEWVNGDSLLQICRATTNKAIEPQMGARVVAEACAGLHAAHELRDDKGQLMEVVHRDVSPHNILMSLEGAVKVADFGVAKARGQIHRTTVTGQIKGKVAYMAPEHLRGRPFDRRADIFSMGSVLYEITTGRQPFGGENEACIIAAILEGTFHPPAAFVPGYPAGLAAIVHRALSPNPDDRFATAEEMRFALEQWMVERGTAVTSIHLGELVRERLGARLAKRAEQLRGTICALDGSRLSSLSSRPTRAKSPSLGGALPRDRDVDTVRESDSFLVQRMAPVKDAPKDARPSPIHSAVEFTRPVLLILALGLMLMLVWASLSSHVSNDPLASSREEKPAPVRPVAVAKTAAALESAPALEGPVPPVPSPAASTESAAMKPARVDRPIVRPKDYDIPSLR